MNSESNAITALVLILIIGFLAFVFFGHSKTQPGTDPNTLSSEQNVKPQELKLTQIKSEFDNRPLDDLIQITSPLPNQVISSPLVIEGKARGFWFFEANFPIILTDSKNKVIGKCIAAAKSDWMTTEFIPFSAKIEFTPDYGEKGTLIWRNDNPSDLVENNREKRITVLFADKKPVQETTTLKVFFMNNQLDPGFISEKVFPLERTIPKTQAVARAALEELLKGPTEQERVSGFYTNINPGVKIQKLSIVDGIAKVDFNEQLEFQVAGSAKVSAIFAQITQTLKQFSTVKEVIISINNRTDDILQP